MQTILIALALTLIAPLPLVGSGAAGFPARDAVARDAMVRVEGGRYLPHYADGRDLVAVRAFELDAYPVTRGDFLRFVTENPKWRRSEVKPIFTGPAYLAGWTDDLNVGDVGASETRVTNVSWFAARAYCAWEGKRLPTTHEWEFAARASETAADASRDADFIQRLIELSTVRPAPLQPVGSGFRNVYGIHDLHGTGWEWVDDFNSTMSTDDSRSAGAHDRQLFCAAGGIEATDPGNYPAFLRFAVRGGLKGATTMGNLGFRCARSP